VSAPSAARPRSREPRGGVREPRALVERDAAELKRGDRGVLSTGEPATHARERELGAIRSPATRAAPTFKALFL
jgi:hypothetical protein